MARPAARFDLHLRSRAPPPPSTRAKGLTETFDGTEYSFCGKGCLLEFRDAPDTYLDPAYAPSM